MLDREIPLKEFLYAMRESSLNGKRYCFILGSGASRSAGIKTGLEIAQDWLDELAERFSDAEIEMKKQRLGIGDPLSKPALNSATISSEDYYKLYELRFHPEYSNGYAYFEHLMETAKLSFGHYPLAMHLTSTRNNVVITTNFDTLVEDAVFSFTDRKPLVVGSETLADYVTVNSGRPIIAKLNRNLFYEPLSNEGNMRYLNEGWKSALQVVFDTYTPIVVGYGGGDPGLLNYMLERDVDMKGIFWCYRNEAHVTEEMKDLVKRRRGYFVKIDGFDELMFMLLDVFKYGNPGGRLHQIADNKIDAYDNQFEEFYQKYCSIKNPTQSEADLIGAIKNMIKEEFVSLTEVINKDPDNPSNFYAYVSRGKLFRDSKQNDSAIKDFESAIRLNPSSPLGHYNRGYIALRMKEYAIALRYYDKCLELDPAFAEGYADRGYILYELNREDAIIDLNKAIALDAKQFTPYRYRAKIYVKQERFEDAMADLTKALEIKPDYTFALEERANLFRTLGMDAEAEDDLKEVEKIKNMQIPAQ